MVEKKEAPENVKQAARMLGGEATLGLPYKGGYIYGVARNDDCDTGLPFYICEDPDGNIRAIQPSSGLDLPNHGNI